MDINHVLDQMYANERALMARMGTGMMIQNTPRSSTCHHCNCHHGDDLKSPPVRSSESESTSTTSHNPSDLRLLGNQHFKQGYFKEAIMYYSDALAHPEIDNETFASDKVACLSNRAEVNLREEEWELAYNDALEALEIQPDHVKSKFLLAKALSRMGQAPEGLALLLDIVKSGVVNPMQVFEIGELANDCRRIAYAQSVFEIGELAKDCRRIAYEQSGDYDIKGMMKEALEQPGFQRLSLYHEDFCSPEIAVGVPIDIRGKSYRGCTALSDLKEGELIMSSKAFAMGQHTIGIMMEEVVQKLQKNPSLRSVFFSLSDGEDSSSYDDDDFNIYENLDRIRDIVRINNFGLYRYDEGVRKHWNNLQDPSEKREDALSSPSTVYGLYINESMLNNSCTPNCQWLNIGDQIFIYTTKPVQAGEELCIDYYSNKASYEERFERFRNWIRPGEGFECVCDHCELLRNSDDLFQLGNEVHEGFVDAEVSSLLGTSKTMALQMLFPSSRRQEIFSAFSHLPLRLQHTQIANLHEMEGMTLAMDGDLEGALKAYQLAAKINYEVRGSGKWEYFMEQWRITSLAIACKKLDLARESLEKVWKSLAFQAYPKEEAELMFRDLTRAHTTQQIPLDPQYVTEIENEIGSLLDIVLSE